MSKRRPAKCHAKLYHNSPNIKVDMFSQNHIHLNLTLSKKLSISDYETSLSVSKPTHIFVCTISLDDKFYKFVFYKNI